MREVFGGDDPRVEIHFKSDSFRLPTHWETEPGDWRARREADKHRVFIADVVLVVRPGGRIVISANNKAALRWDDLESMVDLARLDLLEATK